MKVSDLMSTDIVCVGEETSVLHAAREMGRENIGMLPVSSDRGILKGVITDRDIVLRVLSSAVEKGVFPDDMSCGSIMTKDPVTVTPDTYIHDAALIFATRQVRRLPVIDNSKLVGILSLGDMALKPVLVDEAGDALSAISCPPGTQINK